ncbi:hypothetical protein [Vibrio phage vB_VhaP_PG11]|nr:hypothetical protein [Vibrio phage vB_VhaP_PG11]
MGLNVTIEPIKAVKLTVNDQYSDDKYILTIVDNELLAVYWERNDGMNQSGEVPSHNWHTHRTVVRAYNDYKNYDKYH